VNKVIENATAKMYIKLSDEELKIVTKALEVMTNDFMVINKNFPKLSALEPMTHTIQIDEVILNEDIPCEPTDVKELLKNATHVNGREIEVPKVVG